MVFQSSPTQLKLAFQKVSFLIFKSNPGNEQVQLGQGLYDAGRDPDHLQRVGPLVGPASSHLLHLRHLQVNISFGFCNPLKFLLDKYNTRVVKANLKPLGEHFNSTL
jgi:hypothetical protein